MPETDGLVIEAFLDALQEMRDAREFEALMVGDEFDHLRELEGVRDRVWVRLAFVWSREPSALVVLKGQKALERLQRRHPDVWERAALSVVVCDD